MSGWPRQTRARRSGWTLAIAALLLLPLGTGASPRLLVEKERWIRVETANFTIFSNARERKALSTGEHLEKFRTVLGVISHSLNLDPSVRTYIYLFKDHKSFDPYRKGDVRAYFLAAPDANFVGLNARPTADTKQRMKNAYVQYPYRAVYHEYVHYVLRNNFSSNVPLWVHEGLAGYYGTFWAGGKTADIGRLDPGLLNILHRMPWIPLRELVSESDVEPNQDHRRTAQFYAQSWALVHYLLHGNTERRSQFFDYINAVGLGSPLDTAFADSFTGHENLQKELRAYVGRRGFDFGDVG